MFQQNQLLLYPNSQITGPQISYSDLVTNVQLAPSQAEIDREREACKRLLQLFCSSSTAIDIVGRISLYANAYDAYSALNNFETAFKRYITGQNANRLTPSTFFGLIRQFLKERGILLDQQQNQPDTSAPISGPVVGNSGSSGPVVDDFHNPLYDNIIQINRRKC